MKKILYFLLALSFTIMLAACTESASEEEETMVQDETFSFPASEPSDVEWTCAHDFHEGRAWIDFSCDQKHYSGAIDKTGTMIFRVERNTDDPVTVTDYSNGYAFIMHQDKVDVVDLNGTIVSTQLLNDTTSLSAYGDGYTLIEEHRADFDSSKYVYTIYSPQGDSLKTIETEAPSNFTSYLGKGVFLCNGSMYFLNSGAQIPFEENGGNIYFYEDVAPLGIRYTDADKDGYRGVLSLVDSNGQTSDIELYPEYGWNWDDDILAVKGDKTILYSYSGIETLTTYNLEDGTFVSMPENHTQKVVWEDIVSPLFFDVSGKIALTMRGSDENYYVALFDSTWNMTTEPIQIRSNQNFVRGYGYADSGYVLSEGRFIVSNIGISEDPKTYIYDENGNLIYELYEKGFYGISPYSDGAACVSSWENHKRTGYSVNLVTPGLMSLGNDESPQYLDLEGNLLFEKINLSNVLDI